MRQANRKKMGEEKKEREKRASESDCGSASRRVLHLARAALGGGESPKGVSAGSNYFGPRGG